MSTDQTATNPVEDSTVLSDTGVADLDTTGSETNDLGTEGEGEAQTDEPAEDIEEIEHEGKKFKIPTALKPALMMNADYTRKTQELSEQRRAWEQERTQHTQADAEHTKLLGINAALDAQLEQYGQINWSEASAKDPAGAQAAFMHYQQLKDAKAQTDQAIQTHQTTRSAEAESLRTKQLQDANAVLAKEIPAWDKPETKTQLANYALSQGFTAQELSQVSDPRLIKLIHTAMTNAGKASQAAKVEQIAAGQKTQPAQAVRGAGGKFQVGADTSDFAAFEKMADDKLKKRA
jgi:hypothetical protein